MSKPYIGGIIGDDGHASGVFSPGGLSNPGDVPSLDLNFDGQLSSYTRATTSPTTPKANGDQLATSIVTQNKTGSVQSKYMGPNGKLINGYVENLLSHSSIASWTQGSNMSVTASSVTDPFGGTGAYRIDDQDGAAWRSMDIFPTVAGNTWATLSIYIHASDNTSTKLGFNINYSGGATFPRLTIVNGVPSTPSNDQTGHSSYTGTVAQVAGTDWYRWEIPFDFGVSSISFYPAVTAASSTGYVTVFGAQLELGGAASQLVQTSGATASAQVPRVEYAASGNPLGLLVEEARTNLLVSTEDIGSTDWAGSSAITANDTTAPDGTMTADKIVMTTTDTLYQNVTALNNTTYTYSWYIKPDTTGNRQYAIRNITTGYEAWIIGPTGYDPTTGEDVGNGWYRHSVTFTTSASNSTDIRVYPVRTKNSTEWLWGSQLEQGEGATSYIPNTGTTGTKTRAADNITMATSSFGYNRAASSVFVDFSMGEKGASNLPGVFRIDDGTNTNNEVLYYDTTSSQLTYQNKQGTSTSFSVETGVSLPFSRAFAVRASGTEARAAIDGVLGSAQTLSAAPSTALTTIQIGRQQASQLNGHIRRFTFFPRAVSDASLVAYTGANRPTDGEYLPTRKWGGITGRNISTYGTPVVTTVSAWTDRIGSETASTTGSVTNVTSDPEHKSFADDAYINFSGGSTTADMRVQFRFRRDSGSTSYEGLYTRASITSGKEGSIWTFNGYLAVYSPSWNFSQYAISYDTWYWLDVQHSGTSMTVTLYDAGTEDTVGTQLYTNTYTLGTATGDYSTVRLMAGWGNDTYAGNGDLGAVRYNVGATDENWTSEFYPYDSDLVVGKSLETTGIATLAEHYQSKL